MVTPRDTNIVEYAHQVQRTCNVTLFTITNDTNGIKSLACKFEVSASQNLTLPTHDQKVTV